MQRLREIVDGRRVALVGNASSIRGSCLGPVIDAHEVVIRMNICFPGGGHHWVDDIGEKTDVWATAKHFGDPPHGSKLMVFMKLTTLGDRDWKHYLATHPNMPKVRWPHDLETDCRNFVGADPGTGIRLLWWLRRQAQPESISVYGMDCWETTSHWNGRMNTPNHSPEKERIAMARLLR